MKLEVLVNDKKHPIYIKRGILDKVEEYISFSNKNLVLTDENIPHSLIEKITKKCENIIIKIVKAGETSKSISTYEEVLKVLMENNFTRSDLVISLGGGVIGDLGGYVASTFKRGCRFINIPTTTLSMVDSSIGGKNGINFLGVKNAVGSFYQPEIVLIDPNVLSTLSKRHFNNGLVEALKSGLIRDPKLYDLFKEDINANLEKIIIRSLTVKKNVVEEDPFEEGVRKILNFGHTYGHVIESHYHLSEIYHGEAVALGMLKVINKDHLEELKNIIKKLNIDFKIDIDKQTLKSYLLQDKKVNKDTVSIVLVDEIGKAYVKKITIDDACELFLNQN